MGADYYRADTESGDSIDDPSEDGLLMLLQDLNLKGNTFLTVTPAAQDSAWSASVTRLPIGTYELERSDPSGGEHHRETAKDPVAVARNLTIWLAARDYPHRPRKGPRAEVDESESLPVLSVGIVQAGYSPDKRWLLAIRKAGNQIMELRNAYDSEVRLNVVFMVSGGTKFVDFSGLRTGRSSGGGKFLVVQVAVPDELPENADLEVRRMLEQAVELAERFARRRGIEELPGLRALVKAL